MERLAPALHEHIRIGLLTTPPELRRSLGGDNGLARQDAAHRMADLVARQIARIVVIDEPAAGVPVPSYLPLFPDDRGPDQAFARLLQPFPRGTTIQLVEPAAPTAACERGPFARWLLDQTKRLDPIGDLARCAAFDPLYPIDGDVRAVSARLHARMADADMHATLDQAELDWLTL